MTSMNTEDRENAALIAELVKMEANAKTAARLYKEMKVAMRAFHAAADAHEDFMATHVVDSQVYWNETREN